MGHLINAKEEVYRALAERLNRYPVGAPVNETLLSILHRLYTETEAMVGSKLPLQPLTLEKIADLTGMGRTELQKLLEDMSLKGLILDMPRRDGVYYMLAPMVVGFFEYTFMRVREDINMRELAELFEIYFKDEQVRDEFSGKDTKLMRTLVYEQLIPAAVESEVLTYERASEVIRQAEVGAVSLCSCRHKASHLGKACDAPLEVCLSLGNAARWVVAKGMARPATVDEMLRILDQTTQLGLVHICDNVLNQPAYMCHCCGCCCTILRNIKEYGKLATHPSNFIPALDEASCTGCGSCADACQIAAIALQDNAGSEQPAVNREICIGCSVCAAACPTGALTMTRRETIYTPPASQKEKFMRIAMEKGRLG